MDNIDKSIENYGDFRKEHDLRLMYGKEYIHNSGVTLDSSKIPQGKYNLNMIKDNGKKPNIIIINGKKPNIIIIMEECGTDNRLIPIFDKHKESLLIDENFNVSNDDLKAGEEIMKQLQELGKKQFANEAIAKEQAIKKKHHLHKINQKALQKKSKKKRK